MNKINKKLAETAIADKSDAGMVKCLGWCGKEFYSSDKKRLRFCKRCTTKKENAERSMSNIRSFGDDVRVE